MMWSIFTKDENGAQVPGYSMFDYDYELLMNPGGFTTMDEKFDYDYDYEHEHEHEGTGAIFE